MPLPHTYGEAPPSPTPQEESSNKTLISFTLSSLYDGEDQQEFLQSLSTRIKNHDKDIERMCNKNYQGFIESVSELHKVKSEANKLKVRCLHACQLYYAEQRLCGD